MDVVSLFKKALDIFKVNYIIAVPNLVVNLILTLLMAALVGGAIAGIGGMAFGRTPSMGALGALLGLFGLLMIAGLVLSLVATGAAIGMAKEAIETGKTTLETGINVAKSRLVDLLLVSIIAGVLVLIGLMLLVIPGLVIGFFLMLAFPAVIIDSLSATDALKKSFELVKSNIGDAIILVVGIIVAAFVVGIVAVIIGIIPLLRQLIGIALNAAIAGYFAIVLTLFYNEVKKQREKSISS